MPTPSRQPAGGGVTTAPEDDLAGNIVEAALRAGRGSGFEKLTIRSLAGELGVVPMSLYRYIRDKDDLLDEVADHLLARTWQPRYTLRTGGPGSLRRRSGYATS